MDRNKLHWHTLRASLTLDACAWVPDEGADLRNDGDTLGTLYVRFLGGPVYAYARVPYDRFRALQTAPSAGATYNLTIRGIYDAIEDGDEA
jgi:hypothetical protein